MKSGSPYNPCEKYVAAYGVTVLPRFRLRLTKRRIRSRHPLTVLLSYL